MFVNTLTCSRKVCYSGNIFSRIAEIFFLIVYAPDMPSTLPPFLLIRRLAQHIFLAILFIFRGIAVAMIWLGVLPLVTVWTWRMYFSMGELTCVFYLKRQYRC